MAVAYWSVYVTHSPGHMCTMVVVGVNMETKRACVFIRTGTSRHEIHSIASHMPRAARMLR